MKILFLGEVVGRAGAGVLKTALKRIRTEFGIDLVIANAEGVTNGFGIGFQHALNVFRFGVDVITLGEKAFFKLDMVDGIEGKDRILRPANYSELVPGRGIKTLIVGKAKVCIIDLLGMSGFQNPHLNNPFSAAEALVSRARGETPFVIVVFHASATAEKVSMGYMLDGRASAVVGTHSKVLTTDAQILPKGTAYISDTGRCGSDLSVGGFAPEVEIRKLQDQMFNRSKECWKKPQMQGLVCTLDDSTGFATQVEILKRDIEVPLPDGVEA